MKKLSNVLLMGAVLTVLSCGGKGEKFSTAKDYNDYIVKILSEVYSLHHDAMYSDQIDIGLAKADTLYETSKLGLEKLKKLEPYKDGRSFRDNGIKYVEYINRISKNELVEFLNLGGIKGENSTRKMDLYKTVMDEPIKLYVNAKMAQEYFAEKFGLKAMNKSI